MQRDGPEAAEATDELIADFLRRASSSDVDEARGRLVDGGPAVLRRAVELWDGPSTHLPDVVADAVRGLGAREVGDAWSSLLALLGAAHPETYLAQVEAGRVSLTSSMPVLEAQILSGIEHPSAARHLRGLATHDEWLVRLAAVRGLAGRRDGASVAVLEAARLDDARSVRDEAARALRRRPTSTGTRQRAAAGGPQAAPAGGP